MKAMILAQPASIETRPLAMRELNRPVPGPRDVLIRIAACGVCHTDLHIAEGDLDLPRLPIIPGHQIVGVVEAAGPQARNISVGAQAGVPWLHETCGQCDFCTRGRENLCDAARFTGLHANGGFAQYTVAPADFVYEIPPGFAPPQAAPLLCAGIIGYRALRLSGIERGGRLGMWGFGASAHVAIQVARHWDCEVFVVSRKEAHRHHAQALGAAWTGGPGEIPDESIDAGINFTPAGATVPEGLRALRKGGALALAGIHMSPIPPLEYAWLYGERTVRSVANSTRQDARELLALAAEIPIHTDVRVFGLEEANEALRRVKEGTLNGAAVLEIAQAG